MIGLASFFAPGHDKRAEARIISDVFGDVAHFVAAFGYAPADANVAALTDEDRSAARNAMLAAVSLKLDDIKTLIERSKVAVERAKLTHVAIRFRGTVFSLPAPARHHDVIRAIVRDTGVDSVDVHDDDQGFLDANGTYLNRRQALVSAELFDQLKPGTVIRAGQLFSEDVW